MLKLLKDWLVRQNCTTLALAKAHKLFLNDRYNHGKPVMPGNPGFIEKFPQNCPYVDIVHNEYSCTHGADMPLFPELRRDRNSSMRFSMLTTLRDPIERLGSQAFYRFGAGADVMHTVLRKHCPRGASPAGCRDRSDSALCKCIAAALAETLDILRVNETLWFQWIKKGLSDEKNFMGDSYTSNYYVKRIGRTTYPKSVTMYPPLRKCIKGQAPCEKIGDVNTKSVNDLGHRMHCPLTRFNLTAALEAAKLLLRDHVDFIITERLHEPVVVDIFARVLFDDQFRLHQRNISRENAGHITKTTKSNYASFMPDSVLAYLKEENKYDIELYRYATQLFQERYGI